MENKDNKKLLNDKICELRKKFSLLAIIFVCLVTSTVTFFYEPNDSVNVNIGVSNGIQISVDAKTWKTYINNDDIINSGYDGNTNQLPIKMSAVSSAGEVEKSTGFMKLYKSLLEIDSNIPSGYRIESKRTIESSGTNGDFVAFDLFVLSNEDTAVYLGNTSDVIGNNDCAKNALRVAFLYQGASDKAHHAINLRGAQSYIEDEQSTNIIWEPNVNDESSYYAINQNIYSDDAIDYKSNGEEFTLISSNLQTPEFNDINGTSKTLFNLKEGINKIRIYAWIEGQDDDYACSISTSDIMYNIKITKDVQE